MNTFFILFFELFLAYRMSEDEYLVNKVAIIIVGGLVLASISFAGFFKTNVFRNKLIRLP